MPSSCACVSQVMPATTASQVRDRRVRESKPSLTPQPLGNNSRHEPHSQELGCLRLCALASVSCLCDQISLRQGLLSRSPRPAVGCAGRETLLPVRRRRRQGCGGTRAACVPPLMGAAWASPSLTGQWLLARVKPVQRSRRSQDLGGKCPAWLQSSRPRPGGKQLEVARFWPRCAPAPVYAHGCDCMRALVEGGNGQHGGWWDSVVGGSSPAPQGLAEDGGGRRWDARHGLEEGTCRRHAAGPLGTAPHCRPSPGVPAGMSPCPAPAVAPAQGQTWGSGLPTASGAGLFLARGLEGSE